MGKLRWHHPLGQEPSLWNSPAWEQWLWGPFLHHLRQLVWRAVPPCPGKTDWGKSRGSAQCHTGMPQQSSQLLRENNFKSRWFNQSTKLPRFNATSPDTFTVLLTSLLYFFLVTWQMLSSGLYKVLFSSLLCLEIDYRKAEIEINNYMQNEILTTYIFQVKKMQF